ncbi:MAG: hypothetical protein J7L91_04775 [Candidatus Korarchaeota archaeon]|nr:hypothetical protein [Candidatus Korarchaeota archaeon]
MTGKKLREDVPRSARERDEKSSNTSQDAGYDPEPVSLGELGRLPLDESYGND